MKKGKIFFHPIEGSATLTISWTSGAKGDAVEAIKGSGVGFFFDAGDLLCVIFDEVSSSQDHQSLEFDQHLIEISVKNGKVTYAVSTPEPKALTPKKRIKRRSLASKS